MNLILNQKIRANMALIVAAGLPYTGKSTLVRKIINAKGIQPNILLTFTVALLCCMNTHKFGADNSYICGDTAVFVTGLHGMQLPKWQSLCVQYAIAMSAFKPPLCPGQKRLHSFNVSGQTSYVTVLEGAMIVEMLILCVQEHMSHRRRQGASNYAL